MRGSKCNSISTILITTLLLLGMVVSLGTTAKSPKMRLAQKLEVTKVVTLSRWSFRSSIQSLPIHPLTPVCSASLNPLTV